MRASEIVKTKDALPEGLSVMLAEGQRNAKKAGQQVQWRDTKLNTAPRGIDAMPEDLREILRYKAGDRTRTHLDNYLEDDKRDKLVGRNRNLGGRSIGRDAALVAECIHPNLLVCDAIPILEESLANQQKDSSTWEFWVGLRLYLSEMPEGSRIRDCNFQTVAALIEPLAENLI